MTLRKFFFACFVRYNVYLCKMEVQTATILSNVGGILFINLFNFAGGNHGY